jgi:putative ABC transport system permease protein
MSGQPRRLRSRALFWRVPVETEVDEEIAGHIALQVHRYMARGMSEADARATALARFGDAERVRAECTTIRHHMEAEVRRTEYLSELRQDLLFALRTLRKNPIFTAVAVLTIAIGVGANTAIFSVIDAVLLTAPPYRHADRTVVLFNSYSQDGLGKAAVSAPEMFEFRETFRSLDAIAALRPAPATIVGEGAEPEQLNAYVVTPNLFDLIGMTSALGRTFRPDEGAPGGEMVAILSDGLWRRRFGADPGIVGRSIMINGIARLVVGVMPAGIRFPDEAIGYAKAPADIWLANSYAASNIPQNRGNQNLVVLGRMRPGATRASLDQDLIATANRFKSELPDRYASAAAKNWHVVALTLRDEMVGAVRPVLLLLGGAVGLVLLIACVNVANLLVARGALRQREVAVRLALGATRARLLRQLLTESLVLALGGGAIGVVLAWLGVRTLTLLQPGNIPRLEETTVNGPVLAFSLAISILTGLLVGLFPALQQSRADVAATLTEGARGASDGRSRRRMRALLVVAEVAMALVLLNGAGLLARSFAALQTVRPGFEPSGTMTMYTSLPRSRYDDEKVAAFYERLQTDIAATPGVTHVGGIFPLPMSGDGWSASFDIDGWPKDAVEEPHAEMAATMPGYFRAMGIPMLEGRDFTADDRAGRPWVAIVDESLARKYWPNESAIGKRVSSDVADGTFETVIGVVRHVRSKGPAETSEPQMYLPYLQHPQGMLYSVVRTSASPATLANPMRDAVRLLDRDLPVSKVRAMDDLVRQTLARQRFNMLMLALLALVALGLASIGLYGVMSYLVAQRTREIGIRVALGGQPRDVRWLVVRESLWISVAGLVIGTGVTLMLSGVLGKLLFGIRATDPVTYVSIATLLFVVSWVAAYGPARRATRVAPLIALRD